MNGVTYSFAPGGYQIVDECFLAALTDSVLLKCLSAGSSLHLRYLLISR
jgi:hypothetical protein